MKSHHLRKYFFSLILFLFLLLILLFPAQARNGASSGLLLWFNVLLPTLLPFMILSAIIQNLGIVDCICSRLSARTGKNLYFLYPLTLGLLSGLPLGAKLCSEAVRAGQLKPKQGQFLLTICNNSSAMFLMGFVAENQLQQPNLMFHFLLLVPLASFLSALITLLLPPAIPKNIRRNQSTVIPSQSSVIACSDSATGSLPASVSHSIMDSFAVLTRVGGYVILFSVLAEFLLLIDSPAVLPLVSMLEITTGVRAICMSELAQNAKILLSAVAVSFTGLSGIAQTFDVIADSGLSSGSYMISRCFSALLTGVLFYLFAT